MGFMIFKRNDGVVNIEKAIIPQNLPLRQSDNGGAWLENTIITKDAIIYSVCASAWLTKAQNKYGSSCSYHWINGINNVKLVIFPLLGRASGICRDSMFSFISMNWRGGKPLSEACSFIKANLTDQDKEGAKNWGSIGWTRLWNRDKDIDEDMAQLKIILHELHPNMNYSIEPRVTASNKEKLNRLFSRCWTRKCWVLKL